MANNSLTIHTNRFFGSFLKSPIQMGWLRIINSVTNISRLGTFKEPQCLSPRWNWDSSDSSKTPPGDRSKNSPLLIIISRCLSIGSDLKHRHIQRTPYKSFLAINETEVHSKALLHILHIFYILVATRNNLAGMKTLI